MRLTLPALAAVAALTLAACAPAAPETDPSPRGLPAATMTTRAPMDFAGTARPTPVNMQIEVVVDSLGQPDLGTLRVTGTGASEHRAMVQRWIEASRFRPAQRGGRSVTSLFRTRIESRVEVRRIG